MGAPAAMLALVLLASGLPSSAATEAQLRGRLVETVPPEYPAEAVAARRGGSVEVQAFVEPTGVVRNVVYKPVSPDSASFVAPLEKVLPSWKFDPPVGADCQPAPRPVVARVDFELDGGKPKVFVAASTATLDAASTPPYVASVRRVSPKYPTDMYYRGFEAKVYARIEIGPSGAVSNIDAKAYPRGNTPKGGLLEDFVEASRRALWEWRFPPSEAASRVSCMDFDFRINR